MIPEAINPAINKKAAGTNNIPPEMANPWCNRLQCRQHIPTMSTDETQYPAFPSLWAEDAFPLSIIIET